LWAAKGNTVLEKIFFFKFCAAFSALPEELKSN
jgi:hypothetical protein